MLMRLSAPSRDLTSMLHLWALWYQAFSRYVAKLLL